LGNRGKQRHAHRDAADPEMPRQGEAVPAVVPLSAENTDPDAREAVEEPLHLGQNGGRGVLHQHRPRNAELPDGPAVNVPDLLCGGDLHGFSEDVLACRFLQD
jgi:hypothetical protein